MHNDEEKNLETNEIEELQPEEELLDENNDQNVPEEYLEEDIKFDDLYNDNFSSDFDNATGNNDYTRKKMALEEEAKEIANKKKESEKKVAELEKEKQKDTKTIENKKNKDPQLNSKKIEKPKTNAEKFGDNLRLKKAKLNDGINKFSGMRNKAEQIGNAISNPREAVGTALKDKAKQAAKQTAKKAGKTVAKAAGTALKALMKTPYFWIAVGIAAVLLLIIIMIMALASGDSQQEFAFYHKSCDFNRIETVYFTDTNSNVSESMTLEEFVISVTAAYVENEMYNNPDVSFTDEQIKAIMILVKTNGFAQVGGYSGTESVNYITIYEKVPGYMVEVDNYDYYKTLYTEVLTQLYIKKNYQEMPNIAELSDLNRLAFNINDFKGKSGTAEEILNEIYLGNNKCGTNGKEKCEDLDIYDLNETCAKYTKISKEGYLWPIDVNEEGNPTTTNISSHFGAREINGHPSNHRGIDIAGACDSHNVIATKPGRVIKSNDGCPTYGGYSTTGDKSVWKCDTSYGNHLKIEHEDGSISVYAHLAQNTVKFKKGESVQQGEIIGLIGSSGNSTGCHLHFEIQINGAPVNPESYLPTFSAE